MVDRQGQIHHLPKYPPPRRSADHRHQLAAGGAFPARKRLISGVGHAARTLAKHSAMRIVLVAMKAGGRMEEHHADSDISVHCLDGAFRFEVAGTAHELEAGLVLVVAERL